MSRTAHDIVVRPVVTERSSRVQAEHNQYTFEVCTTATKIEIRGAVEELFDVKVKSVRTMNYIGKKRRVGRQRIKGSRASWKKAIVTLAEGEEIDVLEGA